MRYIRYNNTLGLNYYADMNDAPVSHILRQASIKTENKLMDFSDSSCQDCPYTGRSTASQMILYQGGTIYHKTHVPGPVAQSSAESEYNVACTEGMALVHVNMLIHEFLNKDPDIVPEEAPLITLDSNSDVCMANNVKYTKHTRQISRILHFVRNGENFRMHKIDWCEGGLQLVDIATNNFGDNYSTHRMKYIIVILDK